jgi:hypothetical protein
MNYATAWEFARIHPINRGLGQAAAAGATGAAAGAASSVVGATPFGIVGSVISAVGGVFSSIQQKKAAEAQAEALIEQAKAEVTIAKLKRKTEQEFHIQSVYSSGASTGRTIFLAGIAGLVLVLLMAMKK